MFLTGLIAACGIIFLLLKFPFRKVLQHDIAIDIAATVLLCVLFAGTFAGMMTGLLAGCIISIFLFVSKKLFGYEKFGIIKTDSFPYRKFGWTNVPPAGRS
jgi:MFS superfamily sulfate permease-like transporter